MYKIIMQLIQNGLTEWINKYYPLKSKYIHQIGFPVLIHLKHYILLHESLELLEIGKV